MKTNNKMKSFKRILFGLTLIALTSCQKQPSADFTTDKTEYIAGDVVKLTNTSGDANKFKWTFPDGQTNAAENVDYTTAENQTDGTLTFKLEALSKNGKKTDEATKTVSIKAATGLLTVWTANSTVNQISVSIDGNAAGTITQYYTGGVPACAATGCVTATLKIGSHTISATDGNYSWNGTMTVTKNGCSTFKLQ